MLEVWVCKEEPTLRLVVAKGSALPADLGPRDWKLVGPIEENPEIAREVRDRGYHFFHSDAALPGPWQKNSDAAGA